MNEPTFLRFFCQTDGAPGASELAWSFMRRMIRFKPVLVASMSGPVMGGRWVGYESLRATPQMGSFVNVVCTTPDKWTWMARVPAPTKQLTREQLDAGMKVPTEMISQRMELWTHKVRNVLIVPPVTVGRSASLPGINAAQLESAMKYDCIVVTTDEMQAAFLKEGVASCVIAHPYPEDAVRGVMLAQHYTTRSPA